MACRRHAHNKNILNPQFLHPFFPLHDASDSRIARVVTELCNVSWIVSKYQKETSEDCHVRFTSFTISLRMPLLIISKTRRIFLFVIYFFPGFFERSPSDRWTAPTMTINELHNISWFSVITLIVVHQDITVGLQSLTCTAGKCTRAGVQMQTDLSCEVLQEQHDTHASCLPRASLFRVFTTYEGHSWLC